MWFSSIWSNIYVYIYIYDNICALCRCNNFCIQNILAALPLCWSGHRRKWRDTLRATRDERNWENPRAMMLCSSCMDFPTRNPCSKSKKAKTNRKGHLSKNPKEIQMLFSKMAASRTSFMEVGISYCFQDFLGAWNGLALLAGEFHQF